MFCPKCGSQINDNAKFCTVCGAPQRTAPRQDPEQYRTPEPQVGPQVKPQTNAEPATGATWETWLERGAAVIAFAVLIPLALQILFYIISIPCGIFMGGWYY